MNPMTTADIQARALKFNWTPERLAAESSIADAHDAFDQARDAFAEAIQVFKSFIAALPKPE